MHLIFERTPLKIIQRANRSFIFSTRAYPKLCKGTGDWISFSEVCMYWTYRFEDWSINIATVCAQIIHGLNFCSWRNLQIFVVFSIADACGHKVYITYIGGTLLLQHDCAYMQSSDTGTPTQSVWLKGAWQASNYRHAWDMFLGKGWRWKFTGWG